MLERPSAFSPLSSLTTPSKLPGDDPGRFELVVPDGWRQGKGTFGGLVLGALVRAAEMHLADPTWPIRSLTAELCGPTEPGPALIRVETLRLGGAVATVAMRLVQHDEIRAHAVAVFGRARGADTYKAKALEPVSHPDWADVAPIPSDAELYPEFAKHFEFRNTGPWPFSQETEAVTHGWVKPRVPGGICDAAWVTACADGWWPAIFTILRAPRPIATIAFTLDFTSSLAGLDVEAPLFHVGRMTSAREGYAVETRELWAPDGRLVAINQQTFVVIR